MAATIGRLKWDQDGERLYETGTKNVALFIANTGTSGYQTGVAWNGVTGITESPSGAEATDLWADDRKYATLRSAEQLGGTITAYTYPSEWEQCDGSIEPTPGMHIGQQARKKFALAYISTQGNDTDLNDYGERLHLIYGATASPSERAYATINDSPEAIEFSWEFETTPIDVTIPGQATKPMSIVTIDKVLRRTPGETESAYSARQAAHLTNYNTLYDMVFGKNNGEGAPAQDPAMPTVEEVYTILAKNQ